MYRENESANLKQEKLAVIFYSNFKNKKIGCYLSN